MKLETSRLLLRNFSPADAETLYAIKYDKMVQKYIPDFLERDITKDKVCAYIDTFVTTVGHDDIALWRLYAIELKETGEVVGSLSFGKSETLHEYELGWQVVESNTKKGYASEAAAALADWFCTTYTVDYLIVIMDIDNPASYKTALKSGFKLSEKRMVYDYRWGRYSGDYYYFRRYSPASKTKYKFYGDVAYTGRNA